MPLYTYWCEACSITRDVMYSISDDKTILCNKNHIMTKRFAPVPAIFKGSGFYKTDQD